MTQTLESVNTADLLISSGSHKSFNPSSIDKDSAAGTNSRHSSARHSISSISSGHSNTEKDLSGSVINSSASVLTNDGILCITMSIYTCICDWAKIHEMIFHISKVTLFKTLFKKKRKKSNIGDASRDHGDMIII